MSTSDETSARWDQLDRRLERRLFPRRAGIAAELRSLAEVADGLPEPSADWDLYGEGGPVGALEARLTELLGTQAAAFFPSGVMAQQAALRTWCDRAGTRRIALPDLSHLLVHEDDGPRRLHGFEVEHLTVGAVTPTAGHVRAVAGRLGAVLVELPLRDAGYLLPTWAELVELSAACREREVALHLDGARLWESAPWLGRPLPEICALADSTYVSFYKGLAGLSGAALVGPTEFIAEAKLWRRRHGGTLFTVAPLALSALRGLDRQLPRMAACHEYAVALAASLSEHGFRTVPATPQTVAFRLFAPRSPGEMLASAVRIAEADGLLLPGRWRPADVPGWSFLEVTATGERIDAWPDPAVAASALASLLA